MEDAAEMEATIESMTEELSRSYEDVAALFRFAEELATSTSLLEFLDRSFERLLGLVTAQSAFIRLVSADGISLELIGPTPAKAPWVERLIPLDSAAAAATAFKTGQPVTVENCAKLPPSDPLHHHEGSAFACPIFFRSTPLGCLVVTRSVHLGYFSAGELGLIRVIADFLGIVRTTNLLQEQRQAQQRALRELEIASAIQQSLLPRMFPDDANYRICGVCQSAQEVGGDYFDALSLPRDGILLVIADVMGKGVPAALLATVDIITDESLMANATAALATLRKGLAGSVVTEVLGEGLLLGLRSAHAAALKKHLLTQHILVGGSGDPTVLRLMPPLNVSPEALEALVAAVQAFEVP